MCKCGNVLIKGGLITNYATNGKLMRVYFCPKCGLRIKKEAEEK